MSDKIPTSEAKSTTTRASKHATSASSLTVLNFVLLLLSGTFLFLVATDPEPKDVFTKERWELALEKLKGLTERLQSKEPSGDPKQIQDRSEASVARASDLPDSTLAKVADVSDQLEQLSSEIALAHTAVANITNNPESVPQPSGGEGTVPALLGAFLEESRTPEFRANLKAGELEQIRARLVGLINELPGSRRDSLREEIRDANWLLEAHDILSGPSPETFEDQLGQYVSLSLLIEDAPEGVPEETLVDLEKRAADLTKVFETKLDTLVAAFKVPDPPFSEELLTNCAILADTLAADLDETRRNLPAWVQQWHDWQKEVGEHLSKPDQADPKRNFQVTNQLLQKGQLLEQDFVAYGLPIPAKFSTDLESLRSSLIAAEQKAVGDYQLWALNEIQAARALAGDKALKAIEKALALGKSDPAAAARNQQYQTLIREYPVFRAKLFELSKLGGLNSNKVVELSADTAGHISKALNALTGWTGSRELAQCLNQDLLEQRLLPIEEGLLRRPIDSLYSEVFQECWNYLEGSPLRVRVAKTAATIKKRQVERP